MQKKNIKSKIDVGEVKGVNHARLFSRFYIKHKRLCDEMSGMKIRSVGDIEGPNKIIIDKENFKFAIQRLNSFIIGNLQYMRDKNISDKLKITLRELQNDFNNDEIYQKYIIKIKNLTEDENLDLNKRYFSYLIRCFELVHEIGKYLQSSLSITTSEVTKTIKYYDQNGFFDNLSDYMDEISDNLSDLSYTELPNHVKKIMGYFYTYRYLLGKRNEYHAKLFIDRLIKWLFDEDTSKKISILRRTEIKYISDDMKKEIREELFILQEIFNNIYLCCNLSLSDKNILPKTKTKILIDRSLI